jgi:hypothetical protein
MQKLDKAKLEKLITKLGSGKAVSLRDIKLNLGEKGLNAYDTLWAVELERRKFFKFKPEFIMQYDDLVKQADFANNKYKPNTKHPKPTKHYQAAIDLHARIVDADLALADWFDRTISETRADVEGVARLVTSRSGLKRVGAETPSKEGIKRRLLVEAVNKIETEQQAFAESDDGKKLKRMLADLKAIK